MTPGIAGHVAALALFGADLLVRAVRLPLLVPGGGRGGRPRLSLGQAIAINAYGEAAAAVTPGRLGGDPARFLGFRRFGISSPHAVIALGVETLIDWALLGAAIVGLGLAFSDAGAAGVRHLVRLAAGTEARVLLVAVIVLLVAGAIGMRWYRQRHPATGVSQSLAAMWRSARQLDGRTLALATTLTAVSMVLRTAMLPVLVAGHPGLDGGAVILGSFALLYGQLLLPTPAGAGAVELGFVGGFAGAMSPGELATALLAWRVYSLGLGAGIGAVLLARVWWPRALTSRRYRSTSSPNVRSQL